MLVGTWLDAPAPSSATEHAAAAASVPHASSAGHHDHAAAAPAAHHQHHHSWDATVRSWMFALMLVGCVGGCAWLCDEGGTSRRVRVIEHLGCASSMSVGMVAGAMVATSPAIPSSPLPPELSMHLWMVLGMTAGAMVGGRLVARALGRRRGHTPSCTP